MSGWDFEDVGEFRSERDATDWARRNNIDSQDLNIGGSGKGVDVAVRRSATKGDRYNDASNRRRDGIF